MVRCSEEKVHLTICPGRLLRPRYCLRMLVVGVGLVGFVDSVGVWGLLYSSTGKYGEKSCFRKSGLLGGVCLQFLR